MKSYGKGELRNVAAEDSGPHWQDVCMKIKETTVQWWAVLSHGELSMTVVGGVLGCFHINTFSSTLMYLCRTLRVTALLGTSLFRDESRPCPEAVGLQL